MTYRKRAKSGYCGGKAYKEKSNRQERQYKKAEIKQQIDEHEDGNGFRYRHVSKIARNDQQKLENNIRWHERIIDKWNGRTDFFGGLVSRLRHDLKKLKAKWDEKYGDMRHCNYCNKTTPTIKEDCTICGLSNPYKDEKR